MNQKELVGKKILIRASALPIEEEEQHDFERVKGFPVVEVEVVGYASNVPYQIIIDCKNLGWCGAAAKHTDVIMKNAETYWIVCTSKIVKLLD